MMNKKFLLISLCFFTMLEIAFIVYKFFTVTPDIIYQSTRISTENDEIFLLEPNIPICQNFSIQGDRITKIVIYFKKLDSVVNGDIRVALIDSDGEIFNEWIPHVTDMDDPYFYVCFFYDDKFLPANEDYCLEICLQNNTTGSLALRCGEMTNTTNWATPLYCENIVQEYVTYMDIEYERKDFSALYQSAGIWIFACITITLVIILVSILIGQREYIIKCLKKLLKLSKVVAVCYPLALYAGIIILISILYFATWDIVLLVILFASSIIVGGWILRIFKISNSLICCSIGLLTLGVIISYILQLHLGRREIYLLLLFLPLIVGRNRIASIIKKANKAVRTHKSYTCLLLLFFIIYMIIGCQPINANDALVKHLPISVYAADLGSWYNNIIENVVIYSESTMLSYTYTTLFISFDCYKAITLFNVLLFFCVFGMAIYFAEKIYNKVNKWLLLVAFFTTPYILRIATTFTVDILPIFIVFTFILIINDLKWSSIEQKLPLLFFLVGCAVYTKLTILSSIITLCLLVIGLFVIHIINGIRARCYKTYIFATLRLLPVSFLCLIAPFIVSFTKNWYYTGNPFSITAYNNIFHSPYFNDIYFERPFRNNAMGASLQCFWQVTFKTYEMVEANSGAMGITWLLVIIIPITIILFRNKKLLVWFVYALTALQIAGIVVGNLRYVISIFLIIEILIIISLSLFLLKFKRQSLKIIYCFITAAYILIPNLYFLSVDLNWNRIFIPDKSITDCSNWEILKYVPKDSKVLSFSDSYKGIYSGFYFPLSWYNSYVIETLQAENIDFNQFLKGFDYAILQKATKRNEEDDEWFSDAWISGALDSDIMYEILQTEGYILYQINREQSAESVLNKSDFMLSESPEIVQISNMDKINISLNVATDLLIEKTDICVIVEIACWDKERNLIDFMHIPNIIDENYLSNITTGWLDFPKEACYLDVKIRARNNQIPISNLSINKLSRDSILNQFISDYYNRTLLKSGVLE